MSLEKRMKWIDIKKRKPKQQTRCYCCGQKLSQRTYIVTDGENVFPAAWENDTPLDKRGYFRHIHGSGFKPLENITHWMELPEPPKKKIPEKPYPNHGKPK